jgi:hypothetical protein
MLIHPFVPSARATSPCDPAKSAQTVPLPNGSKLPTASISTESSEENFLRWTGFFTKSGPQIRLPSVPNFGVNKLNKSVEACMDDMVAKTRNSSTLIDDLEKTFASLREYRWKLNPNKCVFGVPSGKLLGFIISHLGIEANPEKISAITSMKDPTCIKDVQKLTGAWRP